MPWVGAAILFLAFLPSGLSSAIFGAIGGFYLGSLMK